jgi:hypothetical protein
MPESYSYQAFISYSQQDREWAQRLWQDLRNSGIEAFYDRESQRAGPPWESQVVDALRKSRHLVVLWSGAAKDSEWVQRELYNFDAASWGSGSRQIIFVVLEGEPKAFLSRQMVLSLKDAGAYGYGAAVVDQDLWHRVVGKIIDSVIQEDPSLAVPILLLTTTRDRMAQLSLREPTELPFSNVLNALNLGSREAFVDHCYGPSRKDWRPFGGSLTIQEILEHVRDDINTAIRLVGGRTVRWEYLDDFWSADRDVSQAEARKLAAGPAVVVVDPMSFYDDSVLRRYANDLDPAFDNAEAFILVLSPFPGAAQTDVVRTVVSTMAGRIYRFFYEPLGHMGRPYARCGPNVGDETDFKGWLINAVARRVRAAQKVTSAYTEVGGVPS